MNVSVCLSVCLCVLPVRDHIFGTTHPIFSKFLCVLPHVAIARFSSGGGVGFMDDVIFAHKPRLLAVAAQLKCSAHGALGSAINCAQ